MSLTISEYLYGYILWEQNNIEFKKLQNRCGTINIILQLSDFTWNLLKWGKNNELVDKQLRNSIINKPDFYISLISISMRQY